MKRSLALLCSLALVLGIIVPGVSAEGTACPCCGATNVTWTNFTADTVPEPGVHYRLSGKVEKSGQWTLETAGTYCIDLAGQTLQTTSRAFIAGSNTTKPAVVLNLMEEIDKHKREKRNLKKLEWSALTRKCGKLGFFEELVPKKKVPVLLN